MKISIKLRVFTDRLSERSHGGGGGGGGASGDDGEGGGRQQRGGGGNSGGVSTVGGVALRTALITISISLQNTV